MPWTTADVNKYSKDIKGAKFKRMWIGVANSTLASCLDKGGSQEECEGKAIRIASGTVKKAMTKEVAYAKRTEQKISFEEDDVNIGDENLEERLTQKRGNKEYWAEDFLVREDSEKSSTWHLPVKYQGKPDHKLMEQAWAALMHPNGFRGKKYSGSKKSEAIKALKALYKSEGQEIPSMKELEELGYSEPLLEDYGAEVSVAPLRPYYGAISFADIHAVQSAEESARAVHELTWQFQDIVYNILAREDVDDKVAAIKGAADEFVQLVELEMSEAGSTDYGESGDWMFEDDLAESMEEEFVESQLGQRVRLIEDGNGSGPRDPLTLEVEIIRPGWGNQKDNHYYPVSVLRRDAKVFEGVKMYTSDHRDTEISERTEVAKVQSIAGFSKIGAPIGRVVVFDPDFAEKTRNRAKAGELSSLECSILAIGKVKPGFVMDGRKGSLVEAIERAVRVDWVTKAGAGGRALRLSESEVDMTKKNRDKVEGEELEEAVLSEDRDAADTDAAGNDDGNKPNPAAAAAATPPELAESDVAAYLQETKLPAEAVEWLKEAKYADLTALKVAADRAKKRIATLTGAGGVFGQGGNDTAAVKDPQERLKERAVALDEIDRKYGLRS